MIEELQSFLGELRRENAKLEEEVGAVDAQISELKKQMENSTDSEEIERFLSDKKEMEKIQQRNEQLQEKEEELHIKFQEQYFILKQIKQKSEELIEIKKQRENEIDILENITRVEINNEIESIREAIEEEETQIQLKEADVKQKQGIYDTMIYPLLRNNYPTKRVFRTKVKVDNDSSIISSIDYGYNYGSIVVGSSEPYIFIHPLDHMLKPIKLSVYESTNRIKKSKREELSIVVGDNGLIGRINFFPEIKFEKVQTTGLPWQRFTDFVENENDTLTITSNEMFIKEFNFNRRLCKNRIHVDSPANSICICSDITLCAFDDGSFAQFDSRAESLINKQNKHNGPILKIAAPLFYYQFYTLSEDGTVKCFDIRHFDNEVWRKADLSFDKNSKSLSASYDGSFITFGTSDNKFYVLDYEGSERLKYNGLENSIISTVAADNLIVTGDNANNLILWKE